MRSVCILVEHKLLFFTSRPGSSSKARIALLSVAVFLFLCSSALWAMDVVDVTLNIRNVWINNLDLPLEERIQKGRDITSLVNWVEDIVYSFEVRMHVSVTSILTLYSSSHLFKFVLGDCIVVWRACVLAHDIPKLWIILTALLVGALG